MRLPNNILNRFFIVKIKDKVKTNGISVIISIRGKSRLKQLYRCVDWVLNQTIMPLEVIIVEDGTEPIVDITQYQDYPEVKLHFIKNDGPFCKSACYNLGVSKAVYDNICGIDADLLMPSDFLLNGYLQLQKYDVCFMANDIYYLEGEMEDMFDFNFSGKTWQTHRATWQFHGGTFFINKQKYYDIGGHDENFKGHGSEDSEFYKRCHDLLTHYSDTHTLLHVEHGRNLTDFEYIEKNKAYLYSVQDIKLTDRVKYLQYNNKYLTGNIRSNSTTIIPDLIPANFDDRIRRLQELQEERLKANSQRLIGGKPNPKDATPVIKNDMDIRRRRVLGF